MIPIALRRWRKAWFSAPVRAERAAFLARLRAQRYDAVIDLQGLLKSALVARRARGPVHGYAPGSGREPIAALFYSHRHVVSRQQSAVRRNRELAAKSLGYTLDDTPDFGLDAAALASQRALPLPASYAAIMPSASRPTKLWPEDRWRDVLKALSARGVAPCLFAGTPAERERASRLAEGIDDAKVLPAMDLRAAAQVLAGARVVVGLDSGLTHLSGALGRPAVGIYCDYDPALAPVQGSGFIAMLGGPGTPPALPDVQAAVTAALDAAASRNIAS